MIPPGYILAPEAARYAEVKQERDFDEVRERMRRELDPQSQAEADSDYERFNLYYSATKEAMRQERDEREATAKAARDKLEAQKSVYRKIMNEHPDPAKRQAAEVAYFRKFVEGGDR